MWRGAMMQKPSGGGLVDGSEVDEVRLKVDGDATNVDETFLLDMIAFDHLSRAEKTIKC